MSSAIAGATAGAVRRGRARDGSIDARVLEVASRHLASSGYDALSIAAVAKEAGTTRQAVYRRWPTKAELAGDALRGVEAQGRSAAGDDAMGDPFADLVAELADFQRGVSRPGRLSLVGTMLQESTSADVRARYQARVVQPRRRRLRAILVRARRLGLIDQNADLDVAVTMATGCWYGRALAGDPPPERWPERSAALVWRAVGGEVPRRARRKPAGPTGRG